MFSRSGGCSGSWPSYLWTGTWRKCENIYSSLCFADYWYCSVAVGILADHVTVCARIHLASKTKYIIGITLRLVKLNSIKICLIDTRTIPLTSGSMLLTLAIYKAREYWGESSGFKGFHLVRILIQDHVLYYGLWVGILVTFFGLSYLIPVVYFSVSSCNSWELLSILAINLSRTC